MKDKIKLSLMKNKPTMNDLVQPNMNNDAKIVLRVSLADADKDQAKILRKAKI